MIFNDLVKLLKENGFEDGWCLSGETLVLWEHDTEPPAPLVRPTETTDEAPTADA